MKGERVKMFTMRNGLIYRALYAICGALWGTMFHRRRTDYGNLAYLCGSRCKAMPLVARCCSAPGGTPERDG